MFLVDTEGIVQSCLCFRNYKYDGIELPVTLTVWDGGTENVELHKEWIKDECAQGRAVMVLDVSGAGANKPNVLFRSRDPLEFYGVNHKLGNDLLWLDDSLAAMRIYDVLRAIDMIECWNGLSTDRLEGFAYGKHGVYIQLAALLDKRIENVKLENNIDSFNGLVTSRHYDTKDIMSIIVPGILKYFDLPDINDYQPSAFT